MLTIAGRTFRSRLFGGTGKFSSSQIMKEALDALGCEMVTVALRRIDLDNPQDDKNTTFASILERSAEYEIDTSDIHNNLPVYVKTFPNLPFDPNAEAFSATKTA